MRVAVLGAGIQGVCVALELAERGCGVDLYDRAPLPVCEASLWNEGKVHLGLIFAKDLPSHTARTMTLGSLYFQRSLYRWGIDGLDEHLSEPFTYVVHRESMIGVEQVEAHFRAVAAQYEELSAELGTPYLGHDGAPVFERVPPAELEDRYDAARAQAAFRTIERSVDPEHLAERLREAATAHPRVTFLGGRVVEGAEDGGEDGWRVTSGDADGGPETRNGYDHVLNALWSDRLRVDAALGHRPKRPWLFRYKLALHVKPREPYPDPPPSTTLMLGPFGDIVNFSGRRVYLSWYPACRVAASGELAPAMPGGLTEGLRADVFRSTLRELGLIVPGLRALEVAYDETDVEGGVIFSWGSGEITDPASELHRRHDIGVHSAGGYHSIDTGKYCMAPLFALQAADRIVPAA